MTSPEPDFDALVDALRSDLPSDDDERRVRARLTAAGVGLAAGVVAPNAAAGIASGSSAPIALLHKLGALSWLTKVGIASVAATAVVPVAIHWSNQETRDASASEAHAALRVATHQAPRESKGKLATASELAAPVAAPAPKTDALRALPGTAPVAEPPARHLPSAPRATSTLGEETALVERALYALRLGDREGARRALAEHARRFPNGLLVHERERALARANEADEGPASP